MVVGITGGIASGKSLVSGILKGLGFTVIDLDAIAREVVKKGSPAWKDIVDAFGRDVLLPDGEIDRKRLGRLVFEDKERLRLLNSITHPRIIDESRRMVSEAIGSDPFRIVFVDAALLIESGYYTEMDKVIIVYADEDTQVKRIVARDGLTEEEALRRIRAQMPLKEKLAYADYVIYNDKDIKDTERQVLEIVEKLKAKGDIEE